jgi:hypothetical protein
MASTAKMAAARSDRIMVKGFKMVMKAKAE